MRKHYLIVLIAPLLLAFELSPARDLTNSPDSQPGNHGYTNCAQAVKALYMQAWVTTNSTTNAEAVAVASIVVAKDGRVVSAKIVKPSGNKPVDESVQQALNRVSFLFPFEPGAKVERRVYTINFDLRAKPRDPIHSLHN